ncbi:MAG: cold shock domain-containing protein [Nitrosomonadaceae bacterium]
MQGKMKWFDSKKGFGFITYDESKEIFVHISEFKGQVPQEGDNVQFEIGDGRQGPCAVNVLIE